MRKSSVSSRVLPAATSLSWARTRWLPSWVHRQQSDAIASVKGVITSFPGGIVASGSKVGSLKYKFMVASTNEKYCPTLREKVADSKIPAGIKAVYEIVIDGVDEKSVAAAMAAGVKAAAMVPGVKFISAGNFGGTLGPYKIELHKIL